MRREEVMADRALYSIKEARQQLGGISRNSVYRLLNNGELASVIIGCRRFITSEAIAQLIKKSATTDRPADKAARDTKSKQPSLPLSIPSAIRTRNR
jgi:Helix-turn-helix domain